MNKEKTDKDLSLAQIRRHTRNQREFENRCRDQFLRNAKDYIKAHPDLKDGRIHFDPLDSFTGTWERYGCHEGVVVAVSLGKDGDVLFDLDLDYEVKKDQPLVFEKGWGVYITDWTYALLFLLQAFKDPYEPEDEEEDEDEGKGKEEGTGNGEE